MSASMRALPLALLALLPFVLAGCSDGDGGSDGTGHVVEIHGMAFHPSSLTVAVGDTVTWTNHEETQHSATFDDKGFDSGAIAQNKSGSHSFEKAGTFRYHCKFHASMTGTVTAK